MRVLFVHQNFPGQFRHIAAHLAQQPGVDVLAIGRDAAPGLPGVRLLRYKPHRTANTETHPYVRSFEDAVLHGQEVARLLLGLKQKGYDSNRGAYAPSTGYHREHNCQLHATPRVSANGCICQLG